MHATPLTLSTHPPGSPPVQEKEMLADLLAKLELRTNERNTAMQDAAAATSRIKVRGWEGRGAEAGKGCLPRSGV
jgi:hypothetical protein